MFDRPEQPAVMGRAPSQVWVFPSSLLYECSVLQFKVHKPVGSGRLCQGSSQHMVINESRIDSPCVLAWNPFDGGPGPPQMESEF